MRGAEERGRGAGARGRATLDDPPISMVKYTKPTAHVHEQTPRPRHFQNQSFILVLHSVPYKLVFEPNLLDFVSYSTETASYGEYTEHSEEK